MKKVFVLIFCLFTVSLIYAQGPRKYGIKCAIVKTVTENANGQKSYNTLWFDDYGARERSVVSMDYGPDMGTVEWVTVFPGDGSSYLLDESRNQASEVANAVIVNYLNMSDEMKAARKAEILGEEMIDGRLCVKWEERVKQILSTAKITSWVWEGIPIKYDIDRPKSSTTLISIEKKSSLPASMFKIPEGYKVKKI